MEQMIIDAVIGNVLDIVIAIITIVTSVYIIPLIRNEFIPWLKDKHIYSEVKSFVEAAEKLAESGIIQKTDKKAKVIELLQNSHIEVDKKVEAFIESAVKRLDLIASSVADELKNGD